MTTTRRRFIAASLAVAAAPSLRAAEAAHAVIDTHTHFYDPTRPQGVPWPGEKSDIYRPVLPPEFVTLTEPLGVTGTVVVEASPWVEDNAWLLALAKRHTVIKGVVGNLDPLDAQFTAHLERFNADPLYRGIRNNQNTVAKALDDPAALLAYKRLTEADLSLDVLGGGKKMREVVTQLASRLPALRIVVDHLGGTRITGDAPDTAWLEGVRDMASHPNVYMKVSALVESTGAKSGDAPKDINHYRPTLDALYESFGPDRVIYGSNWPVCLRAGSYATMLHIVRTYFNEKGADVAEKYFSRNAKKAYKWIAR